MSHLLGMRPHHATREQIYGGRVPSTALGAARRRLRVAPARHHDQRDAAAGRVVAGARASRDAPAVDHRRAHALGGVPAALRGGRRQVRVRAAAVRQRGGAADGDGVRPARRGPAALGRRLLAEVSACTLRAAPPNASGYHVAVVGWDGTNSFVVRAEQMRVPLATSVCPALSGPGRPPREPEPRHSHAAVWLPADQRMVIFGGETLQTRRSFGPRPAGPADHNADELRHASLVPNELWAFELRSARGGGYGRAPTTPETRRARRRCPRPPSASRPAPTRIRRWRRRRRRPGGSRGISSHRTTRRTSGAAPPAGALGAHARARRRRRRRRARRRTARVRGQLHPGGDGGRLVANDLWLFDLTGCDGDGGWRQLHGAAEPPPRYQHAAATPAAAAGDDDSTAFLVFGGRTPAASLSGGRCITWSARRRRRPRRRRRRRRGSSSR